MARDWIDTGPLEFTMRTIPEFINVALSPEDFHLVALGAEIDHLAITAPEDHHDLDVYREALYLMRQSFAIPYQPGDILGANFAAFLWVEMVSSEYLELLSSLKPVALVILAHHCVLLKKCENYWPIKGAPERIMKEVNNILDEGWRPWIAWPLQILRNES